MPVVFREELKRRFHADFCSLAFCTYILLCIALVVLPFIIAFFSHSFWMKEGIYREQPTMNFSHKMLVYLTTTTPNIADPVLQGWSTEQGVNDFLGEYLSVPVVRASTIDLNSDGSTDIFNITCKFMLTPQQQVKQVTAMSFFSYKLQQRKALKMDVMAMYQYAHPLDGQQLSLDGQMEFQQRHLLSVRYGEVSPYQNSPLLHVTRVSRVSDVLPAAIVSQYNARNLSAYYNVLYPIWVPKAQGPGLDKDNSFTLNMVVRNGMQEIRYLPSVPEMLKFAWMQYVSILVVFYVGFQGICMLIYPSQMFSTDVDIDSTFRGPKQHYF